MRQLKYMELRFTSKKPAITDGKREDGDGDGDAKVKLSFYQERVRKSWGKVSTVSNANGVKVSGVSRERD